MSRREKLRAIVWRFADGEIKCDLDFMSAAQAARSAGKQDAVLFSGVISPGDFTSDGTNVLDAIGALYDLEHAFQLREGVPIRDICASLFLAGFERGLQSSQTG